MRNILFVNGLELNMFVFISSEFHCSIFLTKTARMFYASWQAQSNQAIGCLHWLDKGELRLVKAHVQSVCVQIEKKSLTEDN